jgi:hypothetical protein
LTQNIGGLRSAAETQFSLLNQSEEVANNATDIDIPGLTNSSSGFSDFDHSPILSPALSHIERRTSILASIDELPEESAEVSDEESQPGSRSTSWRLPQRLQNNLTAADMFSVFIAHLGPPMVSPSF